jgi:c-di-AMP phosphodiesterase-like protein
MAVYLTKYYLKGVADYGFYAKVFIISFIMFAVLYVLSTFVSDSTITLIPYTLVGEAVVLLCVRSFRLLTEDDKRYLEHFLPSILGKVARKVL